MLWWISRKDKFPSELKNCLHKEKWVRTKLGDYGSPNECILFGKDWEAISPISLLPYIDNNYYGSRIQDFKEELKMLGVTSDFKAGAKFVPAGILFPQDLSSITPVNVFALLDCLKKLKETNSVIPDKFLEKLSQKSWLKTILDTNVPMSACVSVLLGSRF